MSTNPDNLENQVDQEENRRRPVLFIPIIILVLLCIAVSSVYAVSSGIVKLSPTQEPTQKATEEETEVAERIEETASFTAVPTDVPTDEPTPTTEPTDEPTDAPTDRPTETPTDEPTPTKPPVVNIPTEEPTVETFCGDLICNGIETATSCPKDCGCADDGICTAAETALGTCFDCINPGTCDHICNSTSDCASGYTCDPGSKTCQAPFCHYTPPPSNPTTVCSCEGLDNVCRVDGVEVSRSVDDRRCVAAACECYDWAYSEGANGYSSVQQTDSYCSGELGLSDDTPGTAFYYCPSLDIDNDNKSDPFRTAPATCAEAYNQGCFFQSQ